MSLISEDMSYKPKAASDQGFPGGHLSKTTTSRKRLTPRSAHPYAVLCLGASFVVWASMFIYNSSFLGIDGRRYFCLIDDAMISMRYA